MSSATLRSWHEWGVKHPNWHPGLNAPKRPRFKTVREEQGHRMQLACPIITSDLALLPADLDNFLLPQAAPTFEQALNAPTTALPQLFQAGPAGASTGPIAPGGIGGGSGPIGSPVAGSPATPSPISDPVPITPVTPVSPAPVPEPGSIVLTLTGMGALAAFAFYSRTQSITRHYS